jgi:diguanylate cyclase (GGDEF)-like protein
VAEFIGGWRDIEAEVEAHLELERRARTDDLTGLLNRGAGLERLEERLADHRRSARALAVAFCDLDRFKDVNDSHGHAAGDHLLRVVAERVLAVVRADDVVIRMGGDEFLVLLDGIDEIGAATSVAEKVRRVMAVPVPFGDEHLHATMSIGVTVVHDDDTVDALIARADKAMYLGKQAGRDQVVPFE